MSHNSGQRGADSRRYGVYDDYEIDPAENEGERYQFHDVKRQRTERKQMHGGDCECCQAVSC